jgi:hypothetical protein
MIQHLKPPTAGHGGTSHWNNASVMHFAVLGCRDARQSKVYICLCLRKSLPLSLARVYVFIRAAIISALALCLSFDSHCFHDAICNGL